MGGRGYLGLGAASETSGFVCLFVCVGPSVCGHLQDAITSQVSNISTANQRFELDLHKAMYLQFTKFESARSKVKVIEVKSVLSKKYLGR